MNLELFLDTAYSLGIKINRKITHERIFIDIESFFLYCTLYMSDSLRVARYVEYWTYSYGQYLSVKKINDHIKKGHPYRPKFLSGLLKIIDDNYDKSGPLKVLSIYTKNSKLNILENIVSGFEFKKKDPKWESVGIAAPVFIPDELEKTIRDIKWISTNCPEIYFRIQGMSAILSDIKAYTFYQKNKVSLYRIAKDLHLTYACVHQNYKKHIAPLSKL
jgi:hypothetical protein